MNNSFLKIVADDLISKHQDELSDFVVVFPNNRAKLFFNNYLADRMGDIPFWSPSYTTIQSLFIQQSSLQIADSIYCVCKLYEIYSNIIQKELGDSFLLESLDLFYFWGEILLNDFEDVDNNLVDAKKLFKNISDLAEIEDNYDYLTEIQKKALKDFFTYSQFCESSEENGGVKHRFIQIWNLLYPIYSNFKKALKRENLAYEGMLKREIIERLKGVDYKDFKAEKYIFIGFNVLNKCEEALFSHLDKGGKALFYWDYDDYYMQTGHEASVFMRQNIKKFPNAISNNESYFDNVQHRNIKFIASSTENAQTKYLKNILNQWSMEGYKEKDTAIVLCNEALLLPTLHSLPPQVKDVNITMGFPLTQTPIFATIQVLLEMQNSAQHTQKNQFSYRAISPVLNDSYIRICFEESANLIKRLKHEKRYFPNKSELNINNDLSLLFTSFDIDSNISPEIQLTQWLSEILKKIAHSYKKEEAKSNTFFNDSGNNKEEEDIYNDLYKEAIFRSYTAINRLHSLQNDGILRVNYTTITRLINKVLSSISVPFTGEPVKGMQIMGFLETRNLDFNNVVMLSVNEGVVPRSGKENSFIPHNLRKGHGMTTIEHKNSLYAYYFYRLLQRAKNVTLLYNTSTEGTGKGQMSRFMMQMLADRKFNIKFEELNFKDTFATQASSQNHQTFIPKNQEIIDYLINKYERKGKYLSPSALNTYIACPVRFYLSYILNIKEEQDLNDEVDAPTFGDIFHNTMEKIYKDFVGRSEICDSHLSSIKKEDIKRWVEEEFKERFFKNSHVDFSGVQLVAINAMVEFVDKMVRYDKKYETPFRIIGLEKEVLHTLPIALENGKIVQIQMGGRIDRIDEKDGAIVVKDYKTGGTPEKFNSIPPIFEMGQSKFQYNRQILLYAYLFAKQEEKSDIKAAIIYLNAEESKQKNSFCDDSTINKHIDEIEGEIKRILTELFNVNIPFSTETTLAQYCQYCPYCKVCPNPKL